MKNKYLVFLVITVFFLIPNFVFTLPPNLEIPYCNFSIQSETTKSETVSSESNNEHDEHLDHEIHHYDGYSICYREDYEQSEWVAYKLTEADLVKAAKRQDNFHVDPNITTGSATLEDYRGSGYDRGHLAPAADMVRSEQIMSDSFYMSNMSPQNPQLNRGMWAKAEAEVRNWAKDYGIVFVVTGPILEKQPEEYLSIGINKVSVPEFYYKIMLSPVSLDKEPVDWEIFACIIPNQKNEGSFKDFCVTVDEIEERTGIDFFPMLDDETEERIEKIKKN